jgi:hypothetical protein
MPELNETVQALIGLTLAQADTHLRENLVYNPRHPNHRIDTIEVGGPESIHFNTVCVELAAGKISKICSFQRLP